jgi:PAS domain S-box-containing protein
MKDRDKSKDQLINELVELRKQISILEKAENQRKSAENISWQKKLQGELLIKETAIASSINGIALSDPAGVLTYVNDSMAKMWGYDSPSEVVGMHATEFWQDPQDAQHVITVLGKEGKWQGNLTAKKKDGTLFICYLSAHLVLDHDGKPLGMMGSFIDITELKHAEQALIESELALKRAQSLAHIGSWRLDVQQNILEWTHETYRIFGVPDGTLLTYESFLSYVHPDDRKYVDMSWNAALKGAPYNIEHRILVNGEIRWVREIAELEINAGRTLLRGIGTVQDITEQKLAEENIKEYAEQYLTIKSTDLFGYWLVDEKGKLLDVNDNYCRMSVYTREELLTLSIPDLEIIDSPEDVARRIQRIVESGKDQFESKHKDKDGRVFDVEISTAYWYSQRKFIVFIRDITERKKLEEQLLHAQKMESIGTLAGGVAHDFNNILTAIIGFASILDRRMQKDDPLKLYVNQIQTASENATALIADLLTFSRKHKVNLISLDINDIVKKLEHILLRIIGEDIELSTELTNDHLNVMVDFNQMEHVLMNLFANARDAMPDGGVLTIRTESCKLDNEFIRSHGFGKTGMYAAINISDTGTGIDKNIIGRIFEPFFTTKDVDKGTGLGLSIVYGIIKQQNGYIDVYSETGIGTTFRIFLPLIKQEEERTAVKQPVTLYAGGMETILLAEDSVTIRELISSVLAEYGYNVIVAEDGEDAVNKFIENEDHIRLVLFDVIMPKKNGKDAYDEIRKVRGDIKALFISGYSDEILHQRDIIESEIKIIKKPFDPKILLREIRESLDS